MSLGLSSIALGLAVARRAVASRYSFRGRTVVLSGGSRGLGLEIARQLANQGARLWLIARSAETLEQTRDQLRHDGAWVETIAADLRHEAEIDRIVARVTAVDPVIDVLINNAGVIEVSPFVHAQLDDFRESLDVHFWAPLHLVRKLLPYIRRGGEGRIVNISSIGGRIAVPHLAAYAAGKFALTGLSETLRAELADAGIHVTTVTPGLMRTGSYVNVRLRGNHAEELRWLAAMSATPLTSMQARRAARQIVEAARRGRAAVTPVWQARAAQVTAAVAPNTFAALAEMATRALPAPAAGASADVARRGAEVDPGFIKGMLPEKTRREYHQPEPDWS